MSSGASPSATSSRTLARTQAGGAMNTVTTYALFIARCQILNSRHPGWRPDAKCHMADAIRRPVTSNSAPDAGCQTRSIYFLID